MIPVSYCVVLLQHWGILNDIAYMAEPVCRIFGLRGETVLVLITSALGNIYAGIAVIQSIPFTAKEITIMALMVLLAHDLIIETTIQVKAGLSAFRIICLRVGGAIIGGLLLNQVLPESDTIIIHGIEANHLPFIDVMQHWLTGTLMLTFKLICITLALNILRYILDEYGIMKTFSRWITPLFFPMGLSRNMAFPWTIANISGLTAGISALLEYRKDDKISERDVGLFNYHISFSHSLLEDTILFLAIGVGIGWITLPRIMMAVAVVWIVKLLGNKDKRYLSGDSLIMM
jgi:hypothetical protein